MNTSIPLNAHVNTKDEYIITSLDTQEKDVLNKKNTLQFQSTLSPFYTKEENKVYTTSGHTISLQNNTLVDEKGRTYDVNNSYVVEDSEDISKLWSGTLTSSIYYNNKIYATFKTENKFYLIIKDGDTITHSSIDISSSVITTDIKLLQSLDGTTPTIATIEVYSSSSKITVYDLDLNGLALLDVSSILGKDLYYVFINNKSYIGIDDTDVRKRALYYYYNNAITLHSVGFGCIGINGLVTGEPLPITYTRSGTEYEHMDSTKMSLPTSWSSYTFLDNGIGALDNQISTYTYTTNEEWINSNSELLTTSGFPYNGNSGAISWGGVIKAHNMYEYCVGIDLSTNTPLVMSDCPNGNQYMISSFDRSNNYETPISTYKTYKGTEGFSQVDFSDGLGNVYWNDTNDYSIQNGCNPFPYRYAIFNRAESRGVYWDYGPGWAKSYYRRINLRSVQDGSTYHIRLCQYYPTSIVTFGANSSNNENSVRVEWLDNVVLKQSLGDYDNTHLDVADVWTRYLTSQDCYFRFHNFYCKNADGDTYSSLEEFAEQFQWSDNIGGDNMPNHSVLAAIPFNVSLIPSLQLFEQYYQLNYVSTSMKGTLLTSGSANKRDTTIVYHSNDYWSIFSNGLLTLVRENGDIKLEKIADYIYKTNTLEGNNLFIDSSDGINAQRGFIPYNGEEIIDFDIENIKAPLDNENLDGNDTYYSASGYNVDMNDLNNRATSYILPAFTFPLAINSEQVENFNFQLISNKKEITKPLLINQFTYKDDVVDHYYNHSLNSTSIEYQTGHKMQSTSSNIQETLYGVATYDIDKDGTVWWVTSDVYIFPLGIASNLTGINYLSSTVNLTDDYTVRLYRRFNATFPLYNPNTEVYKGSTIFTIYGYNYSFDGQSIYYLGSGDDTSQSNFACYALGMQFLANSGTEAYFYSPFEKRIYLFTGSVTLQIADSLAREGNIIDSLYSSLEQTLYLLTDEGNIIAKTQDDMALIENVDTSYHFEGTTTGMILSNGWNYKKYRLYKTDETEWLPLEYETEFLGKNDSLYKVNNIDVTFFAGEENNIKGNLYYECLNDNMPSKEKQNFEITKSNWKDSKLFKVRLVPKDNVVKAFRFGIQSDDYLHVANVMINVDEVSMNTNAPEHK